MSLRARAGAALRSAAVAGEPRALDRIRAVSDRVSLSAAQFLPRLDPRAAALTLTFGGVFEQVSVELRLP